MGTEYYPFKIGAIECVAISDGTLAYQNPAKILFANAPSDQLTQALRAHNIQPEQWSEWISPFICLLIRTGNRYVLVDSGVGTIDFAPNAGRLPKNLQSAGIALSDIDTVILTHGHPDHIGGITDPAGKAVFTNARYAMWRQEWEFWNSAAGLAFDEFDALHGRRKVQPLTDRPASLIMILKSHLGSMLSRRLRIPQAISHCLLSRDVHVAVWCASPSGIPFIWSILTGTSSTTTNRS